jgi:hypothetical protein
MGHGPKLNGRLKIKEEGIGGWASSFLPIASLLLIFAVFSRTPRVRGKVWKISNRFQTF